MQRFRPPMVVAGLAAVIAAVAIVTPASGVSTSKLSKQIKAQVAAIQKQQGPPGTAGAPGTARAYATVDPACTGARPRGLPIRAVEGRDQRRPHRLELLRDCSRDRSRDHLRLRQRELGFDRVGREQRAGDDRWRRPGLHRVQGANGTCRVGSRAGRRVHDRDPVVPAGSTL